LEIYCHDEIDEPRNKFFRHALALNHAARNSAILQKRHLERDFVDPARAAEQHAGTAGCKGFDRLAHTAGSAEVSTVQRNPPAAIAWISSTTLPLRL